MKLLIYIAFLATIRGDPTLLHQKITIAYGSNFQNYVITQADAKINECFISFSVIDDNSIIRDINLSLDLKEKIYYSIDKYNNRLSSVGHDVCGFNLENVTKNYPSEFMINVIYSNSAKSVNNWNSTFEINYKSNDETILKVKLGDECVINCGSSNDQLECLILNPQGEEVLIWKKPCVYKIYHVIQKDIGRWSCISTYSNTMESLQEHIELKVLDTETQLSMVKTWYEEENGYGMIGCQYINEAGVGELPTYCQFEMPDKNILILTDSLATARYTTFGLNLTAYTCQLEFPLPMLDTEKGLWTCYVGATGGMINTGSKADIPFEKEHEMWLQPHDDSGFKEQIEIFCQVPYMSDTCYIESPTGVIYTNNIPNSWLGQCRTPQIKLNLTLHVGEWKCHFSRPDRALDDIVKVQVRSSDNIKTSSSEDSVSVDLQCTVDYPIKQCRFQDPKGQTYHLTSTKQTGALSYNGRGLEYGECSIKITHPDTSYGGNWMCFVRTKDPDQKGTDLGEVNAILKANVPNLVTGSASAIGIPIGIMCVALVLLFVALYRRFRKSGQAANARSSTDSNQSHSNMPFSIHLQTMPVYDDTSTS